MVLNVPNGREWDLTVGGRVEHVDPSQEGDRSDLSRAVPCPRVSSVIVFATLP